MVVFLVVALFFFVGVVCIFVGDLPVFPVVLLVAFFVVDFLVVVVALVVEDVFGVFGFLRGGAVAALR